MTAPEDRLLAEIVHQECEADWAGRPIGSMITRHSVESHYGTAVRRVQRLEDQGYVIVKGNDLLAIATEAGEDTSDIDDFRQLAYPSLIEYVTRAVRELRESYREALTEGEHGDHSGG